MKRVWAGGTAALCGMLFSAALAIAEAAAPFPVVELPASQKNSHFWSNAAIVSGVGLIAASFAFERAADRSYDEYLAAIDPAEITSLYDETTHYDKLSSAALIGGDALLATGLMFRFVIHPHGSRVALRLEARRCAIACVF